jgi:hypothetical protein
MRLRLARCTTVDPRAWTDPTGGQIHRPIEDLWNAGPDAGRGRSRARGFPDRVLLLVLAHRTNPTMEQLAALFGVSDSAVHRASTGSHHTSPTSSARRRPTGANRGSSTAH